MFSGLTNLAHKAIGLDGRGGGVCAKAAWLRSMQTSAIPAVISFMSLLMPTRAM